MQRAHGARGNRLELALTPEDDAFNVRGDHDKLASLVANLVENAIRYGPEDGTIRVELACNEDGAVTLAVADEGPGHRSPLPGARVRELLPHPRNTR